MPTQKNGIFRIYIEPKNMTVTLTKKKQKKTRKTFSVGQTNTKF